MANGNTVTIVGNLTRDPELRFTPTGVAKATLGVAVNRRWQNRQTNEWEEATSFFNVIAWREMAEHLGESLAQGARVIVTGRIEQRSWETEQGDRRSVVEIVADEIGPSLRWATCEVKKADRQKAPEAQAQAQGQGQGQGQAQPVAAAAPAAVPAGAPAGAGEAGYDEGEEPF